ncbi:uncharacterized protein LOC116942065 isoform X2 [Petromyzon marinus]|uniref:uncharacterized protein LOC116942065 isoform X2 n=1 Tax=Petromyzon marinus TaxID=7757 RepID=UPI003F6ED54C
MNISPGETKVARRKKQFVIGYTGRDGEGWGSFGEHLPGRGCGFPGAFLVPERDQSRTPDRLTSFLRGSGDGSGTFRRANPPLTPSLPVVRVRAINRAIDRARTTQGRRGVKTIRLPSPPARCRSCTGAAMAMYHVMVICGLLASTSGTSLTSSAPVSIPSSQVPTMSLPAPILANVALSTVASTAVAPTTVASTKVYLTTVAPTTVVSTTVAPTTVASTTFAPTTVAPTTVASTKVDRTTVVLTIVATTTAAHTATTQAVTSAATDGGGTLAATAIANETTAATAATELGTATPIPANQTTAAPITTAGAASSEATTHAVPPTAATAAPPPPATTTTGGASHSPQAMVQTWKVVVIVMAVLLAFVCLVIYVRRRKRQKCGSANLSGAELPRMGREKGNNPWAGPAPRPNTYVQVDGEFGPDLLLQADTQELPAEEASDLAERGQGRGANGKRSSFQSLVTFARKSRKGGQAEDCAVSLIASKAGSAGDEAPAVAPPPPEEEGAAATAAANDKKGAGTGLGGPRDDTASTDTLSSVLTAEAFSVTTEL